MTNPEDILSIEASRAKLEAAKKGTLFKTLIALFTIQDISKGSNWSEQTFYDGLSDLIRGDYEKLGCLEDYQLNCGIDSSASDTNRKTLDCIEGRVSQFWDIMRYQTPIEMRQGFLDVKPHYEHLMQNGRFSPCELSGEDSHNIQAIETLVSVYHMSRRAADMVNTIELFSLVPENN